MLRCCIGPAKAPTTETPVIGFGNDEDYYDNGIGNVVYHELFLSINAVIMVTCFKPYISTDNMFP